MRIQYLRLLQALREGLGLSVRRCHSNLLKTSMRRGQPCQHKDFWPVEELFDPWRRPQPNVVAVGMRGADLFRREAKAESQT
jgi:hypothetical protein